MRFKCKSRSTILHQNTGSGSLYTYYTYLQHCSQYFLGAKLISGMFCPLLSLSVTQRCNRLFYVGLILIKTNTLLIQISCVFSGPFLSSGIFITDCLFHVCVCPLVCNLFGCKYNFVCLPAHFPIYQCFTAIESVSLFQCTKLKETSWILVK